MAITKQEIKERIKLIFYLIFAWMIAIPLMEKIVEVSPVKDTLIIGIVGIIILMLID